MLYAWRDDEFGSLKDIKFHIMSIVVKFLNLALHVFLARFCINILFSSDSFFIREPIYFILTYIVT